MKTIAIANHKGGVGKTATSHALGVSLAKLGRRVLLVDLDPQASLTNAAGVINAEGRSMAEVVGDGQGKGQLSITDILLDASDIEGTTIHLAPSDIQLSINEIGLIQRIGRESILKNALGEIATNYDICLIDCPPSLSILTINALRAANYAIIPTQPQISDLRGLNLFVETVAKIKGELNPNLKIAGILVTFYDSRLIHHQDALAVMKKSRLPMLNTTIGRSVRVAEAPAAGESIVTYDPHNPQAKSYQELAKEISTWLRKEQK